VASAAAPTVATWLACAAPGGLGLAACSGKPNHRTISATRSWRFGMDPF